MSLLADNPVLQKEMRGRFRPRRQARGVRIGAFITIIVLLLLLYYFSLSSLLSTNAGNTGTEVFNFCTVGIELTIILFMCPSLASSAITQEREQQTWNALLLSRLSHAEIIVGKFIAALIPALLVLAVLLPLKLFVAAAANIHVVRFVLVYVILLTTIGFVTAVSLFCSWACRRTYAATAATFGIIAFLTIGTWLLYGLFAISNTVVQGREITDFVPLWLNPYVALGVAVDFGSNNHLGVSIFYCIAYLFGTAALLTIATKRLARGPKELEQ